MIQEKMEGYDIVLASTSPRRQELLALLDINFRTTSLGVEESFPNTLQGQQITEYIALKKAEAYNFKKDNEIVITADTLVLLDDDKVLGKPTTSEEAIYMLESLSGKKHRVLSSYCVFSPDRKMIESDVAEVYMKALSIEEIKYYVSKYKPLDKAGAYAIQEWIGAVGIEKIIGSYYTIMGLPIHKLHDTLLRF